MKFYNKFLKGLRFNVDRDTNRCLASCVVCTFRMFLFFLLSSNQHKGSVNLLLLVFFDMLCMILVQEDI